MNNHFLAAVAAAAGSFAGGGNSFFSISSGTDMFHHFTNLYGVIKNMLLWYVNMSMAIIEVFLGCSIYAVYIFEVVMHLIGYHEQAKS